MPPDQPSQENPASAGQPYQNPQIFTPPSGLPQSYAPATPPAQPPPPLPTPGSKLPLIIFATLFMITIIAAGVLVLSQRKSQSSDSPSSTNKADYDSADTFAKAQMRGRDTDRKNELKNLKTMLEIHYGDYGSYPRSLSGIDTPLSTDQMTDPQGKPYTYEPGADLQTYTLKAELENDSDLDANENGMYVLLSVNNY